MSSSGHDYDFSSPSSECDVCLVVEGQKLYTSKALLSDASPVSKNMFEGDYKEKTASDIPLPDKKHDSILQLLRCISPSTRQPISEDNFNIVLPLVDEYLMDKLKTSIGDYISKIVRNRKIKTKEVFRYMVLAKQYKVDAAYETCLNTAKLIDYDLHLKQDEEFFTLPSVIKCDILSRRLTTIEVPLRKFVKGNSGGELRGAFEDSMAYHCERGHRDSDGEEEEGSEQECYYESTSYCTLARRAAGGVIWTVASFMEEADEYFQEVYENK